MHQIRVHLQWLGMLGGEEREGVREGVERGEKERAGERDRITTT